MASVSHPIGWCGPWARWRGADTYPILHLFAFDSAALRQLAERGGFQVLSVLNSDLGGPAQARALATTAAGALGALSGGRWLIGPSIELYARRGGTS